MSHDFDCNGAWHPYFDCEDGYVEGECGEDSCCCVDPQLEHGLVMCSACRGRGGWPCPDADVITDAFVVFL